MVRYVKGHIEDRVSKGDERIYHYPYTTLPNLEGCEFPDLESSFITAQKLEGVETLRSFI